MMKKSLLKFFLVAIGLVTGMSSAWADDIASNNFNDQTTPFIIADANRLSASYALYEEGGTDYYVKYSCGNMNAVAFAYYNFYDNVSNAATVTVDFDFYIPKVSGHELLSLADADYHTLSQGGFTGKSNTGYGSNGAIFNLGCFRAGGNDYFAINSTQNSSISENCLGKWCHASITVDNLNKTVDYTIKNSDQTSTLASATGVSFLNSTAQRCSQIDIYIGTNATGNAVQIDNLVITKTISEARHSYTVNAVAGGTTISTIATGTAVEANSYDTYIPKVIAYNGKYYVLDDDGNTNISSYYASYVMGTQDATNEINYTLDESITFFGEIESLSTSAVSNLSTNSVEYSGFSNGYGKSYQAKSTGTTNAMSATYTINISGAGAYELVMPYYNSDSKARTTVVTVDLGEEGAIGLLNASITSKASGTIDNQILLTEGDHMVTIAGTYNLTAAFDYILVRKIADVIDVNHNFIGALDYSTASLGDMSEKVTLTPGSAYHYKFVNHNNGGNNWQNYIIPVYNSEDVIQLAVRADNWENVKGTNAGCTSTFNWDTFVSEMNGATVDMIVNYSTDNVFTMSSTITTASGETWTYSYTSDYADSGISLTGDIQVALSVENSWLEVLEEGKFVSKTFPSFGYATFSHTAPVTVPEGVTVYTGVAQEGKIVITAVDATVIPANTGVMIQGEGSVYFTETTDEGTAFENNEFIPTSVEANQTVSGEGYYGLSSSALKFIKVGTGVTFSANKAYIKGHTGTEAKSLSVTFGDDATAIENIEVSAPANAAVYNLSGQKVDDNYKGIIIKNGKKYLNK